jgi:hypothetical protein
MRKLLLALAASACLAVSPARADHIGDLVITVTDSGVYAGTLVGWRPVGPPVIWEPVYTWVWISSPW